jgi:16S rRNA (guanine527-N7)-methyltransferase
MPGATELLGHEPLLTQLERARTFGFLGPGPVADHIEHAEAFVTALAGVSGTVVDLGSGGGVPGLIIALTRADLSLVLVEATAKRCRFLEEAVAALALTATVVEGRAEVVGHSERRGKADAVVARSFGTPATTAECGAPLLRRGGILVVSEPPAPTGDRWPSAGLAKLGLERGERSPSSPAVQVLRLTSPCPPTFPRRDGLPAKRPLF